MLKDKTTEGDKSINLTEFKKQMCKINETTSEKENIEALAKRKLKIT